MNENVEEFPEEEEFIAQTDISEEVMKRIYDMQKADEVEKVLRSSYHFYDICDALKNKKGIIDEFKPQYIRVLIENILSLPNYAAPVKFLEVNKKSIAKVYQKEDFFDLFTQAYLNILRFIINKPEDEPFFHYENEMEIYGIYQTLAGEKTYTQEGYFLFMEELVDYMSNLTVDSIKEKSNFTKEEMYQINERLLEHRLFEMQETKIHSILMENEGAEFAILYKKIDKLNFHIEEIIVDAINEHFADDNVQKKPIFAQSDILKIGVDPKIDNHTKAKLVKNCVKYSVGNGSILANIDDLRTRFPIFEKFLDFVENECILNDLGIDMFQLPATLLVGEPGIGKTFFLNEFAKAIGVENFFFNMGGVSGSFEFSGSNPTWMNAGMGQVMSKLLSSPMINPVFILDEIDKLNSGNYPITPILLPLMEKHTARSFKDEFIGYPADTSNITWLATANQKELIDKPLLSRMIVFTIPSPNMQQRKVFAKQVYASICRERKLESFFAKELEEEFLSVLCRDENSTRDLGRTLTLSLSNASKRSKDKKDIVLIPEDYKIDVEKKRSIGFIN